MSDLKDNLKIALDDFLDSREETEALNAGHPEDRDLVFTAKKLKKHLDSHLRNKTEHLSSPGKRAAHVAAGSKPSDEDNELTAGKGFDKAAEAAHEKFKTAIGKK